MRAATVHGHFKSCRLPMQMQQAGWMFIQTRLLLD
jgi:hypothetical protein